MLPSVTELTRPRVSHTYCVVPCGAGGVIGRAGQLELFEDGIAGYHWQTLDELVARTGQLMADPVGRAYMADQAVEAAGRFGPEPFTARLEGLVAGLDALAVPGR